MDNEQIIEQFRELYALSTDVTSKCYDKCIKSKSETLSKSEQTCVAYCAARFFEAKFFITKRIFQQTSE